MELVQSKLAREAGIVRLTFEIISADIIGAVWSAVKPRPIVRGNHVIQ